MLKKLGPILLLNFVNIFGFSFLIPILPSVVEDLGPSNLKAILYGGLLSTYAVCQFLAAPIFGSLSDKYGRKKLLVLSQFGTFLSWIVFGSAYFLPEDIKIFSISLPLLVIFFSRVTDGITGGNISVANAWLSDVTTKEEKSAAFGYSGATFGLGFLLGPALGGISYGWGLGILAPALIAGSISLVALIYIYFLLPETLPSEKREKALQINFFKEINVLGKIQEFKDNVIVYRLLWVRIIFALVFSAYTSLITLFLEKSFGLSPTGLGIFLSVIGVFSVINQAVIVSRISKKYGEYKIFFLGLGLLSLSLIAIIFIPTQIMISGFNAALLLILLNNYFANLGLSCSFVTFKSILLNNSPESKQGMASGVDESLIAFGNAVSPLVAGLVFSQIGASTFVVYGSILLIIGILSYLFNKKYLQNHKAESV